MIALVVFILVLSFLVIIHELGHYVMARWAGVRVHEFGLGYPPKAKTLFHIGKTAFTLNWIPFGGFVRLAGDDTEPMTPDEVESPELQSERFSEKSKFKRMLIILGGVTVNIIFGMIAFSTVYSVSGIPTQTDHPYVIEIAQSSPAEDAGIQTDDYIRAVNQESFSEVGQVISAIRAQQGNTIEVEILRGDDIINLEVYVRTADETPVDQGSLGVSLSDVRIEMHPWWVMIPRGIQLGIADSISFSKEILMALGGIAKSAVQDRSLSAEVAGPVGIVHLAQREGLFEQGPVVVLYFAGMLSINLAIMNLLPIPALDGGRGVFILLESVLGKKRRVRWEAKANAVGMLFLLGLILLISIQDVARIVLQ